MHRKRRLNIQDLNPHLICVLCGGYFIDATTIIECLHSFCKSCIVRHLEGSKYCPICDVQVHKTKPLQNIRQDPALQDIVYKLVPGLFQNEMRRRREFLNKHPEAALPSSSTLSVPDATPIYTPDETFSLTLEYWKSNGETANNQEGVNTENKKCARRYLRCPGAVTVSHLQKLIRAKFELSSSHIVEFLYKDEVLEDYLTLMDIAYIFKWRRKGPLNLSYRISECSNKRMKLNLSSDVPRVRNESNESPAHVVSSTSDCDISKCDIVPLLNETSSNWKEVQLQISETGIMSVTGITAEDNVALDSTVHEDSVKVEMNKSLCKASTTVDLMSVKDQELKAADHKKDMTNTQQDADTKKVDMQSGGEVKEGQLNQQTLKESDSSQVQSCEIKTPECNNNNEKDILYTNPIVMESLSKSSTVSQGNSTQETERRIKPLSNSKQCKTIDSNTTPEMIPLSAEKSVCIKSGDVTPNIDSVNFSGSTVKEHPKEPFLLAKNHKPHGKNAPVMVVAPTQNIKKSNSGSMGYKTLKVPPKTWNPSITRSSYLQSKNQSSNLETNVNVSTVNPVKSSEKAPRFFKMRNMPRYLGNPASGVKPMYQVAGNTSTSKVSNPSTSSKSKPVVMKIDPKTLSPIISTMASSNTLSSSPNKAFYSTSQASVESTMVDLSFSQTTATVLSHRDQGKTTFNSSNSSTRVISTTGRSILPLNTDGSNTVPVSPPTRHNNRFTSQTSSTGNSSTIIGSSNVVHPPNYTLNTATLNMLASNPSFLPNATNFLYGNFTNFAPPLLRASLHLNNSIGLGPGIGGGSGLGAYHSMPPSVNMLFPHHRSTFPTHPPAVQRIPPSKNNTTSNIGHKLQHVNATSTSSNTNISNNSGSNNSNHNSSSTSPNNKSLNVSAHLNKSSLQSTLESCSGEDIKICNPKNGIDSKQSKNSNSPIVKQKHKPNEKVHSCSDHSNIEFNLGSDNNSNNNTNNNNNKTKPLDSSKDSECVKLNTELAGTCDKREVVGDEVVDTSGSNQGDSEVKKCFSVFALGPAHSTDEKSEKPSQSTKIQNLPTPVVSSSCTVKSGENKSGDHLEVEKSSTPLTVPAASNGGKSSKKEAGYNPGKTLEKADTRSKDTIEPMLKKI